MAQLPKEAVQIRRYAPETDEAFIYSSWLNTYKHDSYFAKRIKPYVFFKGHRQILNHILFKPIVKALIAHPKDEPDTITGYLIYERHEKPVVHFVFVKKEFQKLGIARTLFDAAEIDPQDFTFTHWTMPVNDLIQKYPNIIYDPYSL